MGDFEQYVDEFLAVLAERNRVKIRQWIKDSPLLKGAVYCSEALLFTYLSQVHQWSAFDHATVNIFFTALYTKPEYQSIIDAVVEQPVAIPEKVRREKRQAEDDVAMAALDAGVEAAATKLQKSQRGRLQLNLSLFSPPAEAIDVDETQPADLAGTLDVEIADQQGAGGSERVARPRPGNIITGGFTPV